MHKDELTMLRKQAEEIAKTKVTDTNRENLLKKLCLLQTRYRVFEEYMKPEDIEILYGTKFNILAMDMHKKGTNPFTSDWVIDDKELQYYKQILDKKIERIVKGENAEFARVFGSKQANAVMEIRALLKSKKTGDSESDILSNDTMLLGLILAFDKGNGFEEFYKNHRFLKYGYSSGAQIYKECGLNVQEEPSLEAAYQLENFLEETIGKKSKFNRNNGFLRLYGIYYKENVHKNKSETLMLPEGIVYIGKPMSDEITLEGRQIQKRMKDSKTIIFPSTLKEIGLASFANCCNLEAIKLNEGLVHIGNSAFADCKKLKWLECPKTLRKIDDYAFYRCEAMREIGLNEGLVCIDVQAFKGCSGLREVVCPNSLEKIGFEAFDECNNLRCVILNEGLTIGLNAFAGSYLSLISIPENGIKYSKIIPENQWMYYERIYGLRDMLGYKKRIFKFSEDATLRIRGTDIPKEALDCFKEYSYIQGIYTMEPHRIELFDDGETYELYFTSNKSFDTVITELEAMAQKRKKEKGLARE